MTLGRDLRLGLLIAGLCGGLLACNDEEIRAYREPKQVSKGATTGSESKVVWTVPAGWESVASDQAMRLATFRPGADLPEVTLAAFPGDTGGLLANINRWRGQLGLAPIEAAQLAQTTQTTTIKGVTVTTVELTGSAGQQMLGAVIVPGDGKTWFVKATGDPAAITKLKPAFGEFAQSFRLAASAPAAPTGPAASGTADVQSRLSAWKPPSHWTPDPKPAMFVTAGYDVANSEGGAKVTATTLPNNGGGTLSNVNRWRDQLGLPPVENLDGEKVTDLGGGCTLVELSSSDNARRMLAAIIPAPSQTWFFKVSGTAKGVDAERAHFERFIRAVGLGEGPP